MLALAQRRSDLMAVQVKTVTVAHSPDSDDAFMFYALAKDKMDTRGLEIKQVLKDIQSLNHDAINGRYEVSAVSFAAYPLICDKYALMPCGASMGYKYGPMIVAKKPMTAEELRKAKIAIPGKLTSAYLTLQLYKQDLNVVEHPFDQIIDAVVKGDVDAGLLIHEGQLTYKEQGLHKIVDLGEWWFEQTGLPLPLGGNVVRKDLGAELMKDLTQILKAAIVYSLEHRKEALAYALEFARDMKPELADEFVGMYVNELTVDYGETGRKAVRKFFDMAYERGIFAKPIVPEFVDA
jgi:1,4-dihydroxy-6-naphthoate synthase